MDTEAAILAAWCGAVKLRTSDTRWQADRGLYVITDGPRSDLLVAVEAALAGGARLVQYRDKTNDIARRLSEGSALAALCSRYDVPLIINGDVQLASAVHAAGVHLGADGADIDAARRTLGTNAIIGVSCYDSVARARGSVAAGADYVAFGAFFASVSKPTAPHAPLDVLRHAAGLGVPLVAIGGITPDNAPGLIAAGAHYLAVISAVFAAGDIAAAARQFASHFPPRIGS